MMLFKFASLFMMCASADQQSRWEGVQCRGLAVGDQKCRYGLEKIADPKDPSGSGGICCQKGLGSTYDNCKCLPCEDIRPCDTTQSAQEHAYHDYKRMGFSDEDAKEASDTYICAWNPLWDKSGASGQTKENKPKSEEVKPIFKCCQSLEHDHKCKCPPKDDTKKCYSKWANKDLQDCTFGFAWTEKDWGKLCCVDRSTGNCKGFDDTNVEGFEDWAKCGGAFTEEDCGKLAEETRYYTHGHKQTSGCVWDVMPSQKYCGLEVESADQCEDQRPNSYNNSCGLSAMSDTEWFVDGVDQVQFAVIQAMNMENAYCGQWWIDHPGLHPVTGKSALLV